MNGLFFGVTIRISCRAAHHEASRRNVYELHAFDISLLAVLQRNRHQGK
jgi:hypothetical protein